MVWGNVVIYKIQTTRRARPESLVRPQGVVTGPRSDDRKATRTYAERRPSPSQSAPGHSRIRTPGCIM